MKTPDHLKDKNKTATEPDAVSNKELGAVPVQAHESSQKTTYNFGSIGVHRKEAGAMKLNPGFIQRQRNLKHGTAVQQPFLQQQYFQKKIAEAGNSNAQTIDKDTRSSLESFLSTDLGKVKIHNGPAAHATTQMLNAHAYTTGNHIFLSREVNSMSPLRRRLLLAHEVVHTLQQQHTSSFEQMSANPVVDAPDSMHEQEAGKIENAFTQAQQGSYRSPALKLRSQMRISPVIKPAIQRSIKTWGGEWDTELYKKVEPATAGGSRGAEIKLKFSPGANVDAELIGLSQTARAIKSGAVTYIGDKTRESHGINAKDAIEIDPVTKEKDEGTHIDRIGSRNNPVYGASSLAAGKGLQDTPMDNNATTDPINLGVNATYQLGFRFTSGKTLKTQDAKMYDKPTQRGVDKDSSNTFEVAAIGLKGAQAGTFYGSVKWGWRTDSKGTHDLIPLGLVSQGVPSSSYIKAAELWNAGKDSTGADTVDLPIVDVKITTAPISAQMPAGFVGPAMQIPAGTRVQILRAAVAPATNGIIKVVDGVNTGFTLEVSPSDMALLRDERP